MQKHVKVPSLFTKNCNCCELQVKRMRWSGFVVWMGQEAYRQNFHMKAARKANHMWENIMKIDCWILGFHGGDYEAYGLRGCNAVYLGDIPTFLRSTSPPSSRWKGKPSKIPAEAEGKLSRLPVLVSCLAYSSILRMVAICSSETSGFLITTWKLRVRRRHSLWKVIFERRGLNMMIGSKWLSVGSNCLFSGCTDVFSDTLKDMNFVVV
jgi:hypothetical protein